MTDLTALSGRVLRDLREVNHVLHDAGRTLHEEVEAVNHVRRLLSTWALQERGFKI